eukprot:TRINITY_DN3393_c1_g2_i5.p1 TRINITY_DN3393_c1_g2~~TRINITY_DN3393_c1_g2_i5.p1  ORF type:complete len:506 (+),score=134.30 TRINITY_DN3393_c1_g2_i5:59-1519(+)
MADDLLLCVNIVHGVATVILSGILLEAYLEHRNYFETLSAAGRHTGFTPLVVLVCLLTGLALWRAMLKVCYGGLRHMEGTRMVEHALCHSGEMLVTMTVIVVANTSTRTDISAAFLLVSCVMWRCMHIVAEWRVSASEDGDRFLRARTGCLLVVLLIIDVMVASVCIGRVATVSFSVLVLHEFLHLAGICVSLCSRLALCKLNDLHEGIWQEREGYKAACMLVVAFGRVVVHVFYTVSGGTPYPLINLICSFRALAGVLRQTTRSFKALRSYHQVSAKIDEWIADATEADLGHDEKTCVICIEDITLGDAKKLHPCGHMFHRSCIRMWLHRSARCPYCRQRIRKSPKGGARSPKRERRRAAAPPPAAPPAPPPPPPPEPAAEPARTVRGPVTVQHAPPTAAEAYSDFRAQTTAAIARMDSRLEMLRAASAEASTRSPGCSVCTTPSSALLVPSPSAPATPGAYQLQRGTPLGRPLKALGERTAGEA